MATPRDIRRMAFSALFQLDAVGDEHGADVRASLDDVKDGHDAPITEKDRDKAFELAKGAFAARMTSDREVVVLSPGWPPNRQPAVDRAIIRLAHFEMTTGRTSPKIAVNEAVELAKEFSTDRSPAFVNGVLDKILKRVLKEARGGEAQSAAGGGEKKKEEDAGVE